MSALTIPIVPKDPTGNLQVVAIGRVSTIHQNVENIAASHRYVQEYLTQLYRGPMDVRMLGEQASGMLTDRATIREAEALVATGQIDLVIAEDLARIYRNPRFQYDFVQNAVDAGTRVICIGDNLDTADENWEVTMGAAALRHGLHIPDTRRRVRRTATHSFHTGGMVQKVRFGYRKLTAEEAATGQFGPKGLRITKRPECTPVIREMMARVLAGQSYSTVADWLNDAGVEPGAYATSGRWSARRVMSLLSCAILSGTRTFRVTICRPVFRTGRHLREKNAAPETEHYPDLAHITREEHAALRETISRRVQAHRAKHPKGSPRRLVPRSRSLWPGQAATCAICGSLMYYAGAHLRCSRSIVRGVRRCWNHVQLPALLARERLVAWLAARADQDAGFRALLVESISGACGFDRAAGEDVDRSGRRIAKLERQAENLAAAIAAGGRMRLLLQKLKQVETDLVQARAQLLKAVPKRDATDYISSKAEFAGHLREGMLGLACNSFDFADWLRRLVVGFRVQPVQALDTPLVRPRGYLELDLQRVFSPTDYAQLPQQRLEVVLDLFDPAKPIAAIGACATVREEHPSWSLAAIASHLQLNKMTVKRAFDYARRMQHEGYETAYRELTAMPLHASRWKRRCRRELAVGQSPPTSHELVRRAVGS